jgi:uncharacterized protein (UPF0332 family)
MNVELSKVRFDKAVDDLNASSINLKNGQYKTSLNRAYYAVFHAMRAVHALDKFDSSKHSAIVAKFRQNYIKAGVFDNKCSEIISLLIRYREQADYDDFFIATQEDAAKQFEIAQFFIEQIRQYLEKI